MEELGSWSKIVLSRRVKVPLSFSDCGPAWGSETGIASSKEGRDPVLRGCWSDRSRILHPDFYPGCQNGSPPK